MENMELLQAMRQMLSENNRQMMDEMHRQLSENNRQIMGEMHTQIQDAVAPIYSRLDSMDARLDSMDARLDSMDSRLDSMDARLDSMDSRLDKVESELQSVKTLATKTQLIVENEIDRKLNLLIEGHLDMRNRVAQLEQMNEILHEVQDDVWALKHIVSGRIVPGKPRSIRRKPN